MAYGSLSTVQMRLVSAYHCVSNPIQRGLLKSMTLVFIQSKYRESQRDYPGTTGVPPPEDHPEDVIQPIRR